MLNFLQQHLGRSPSKSQNNMTRQQTIESAFGRVNARNVSKDPSTTPSLTTATSMTDASSELTDSSSMPEPSSRYTARSRSSISSFNENLTSGKNIRAGRKYGREEGVSNETTQLHDDQTDSKEALLQQSVQALDGDWDLGAMPGDELKAAMKKERAPSKRRSTRLDILDAASSVIEKTTSVLGKRGRETMEAGGKKIQSMKGGDKNSKTPRELQKLKMDLVDENNRGEVGKVYKVPVVIDPLTKKKQRKRFKGYVWSDEEGDSEDEKAGKIPSFDSPRKRARFSKDDASPEPAPKRKPVKKAVKKWVNQGLYVGQDPDFDPKLTETKNKEKKALKQQSDGKKSSVMPLPMFAGKTKLELGRDFRLPFDVFSPLPPGQSRPDEWKKTHKNVFIGDAASFWKKAKTQEQSTCICTSETGCDDDCFNRFMLYECDETNCNVGPEHCTNRPFADLKKRSKSGRKYDVGVEVMETLDRGHGVRAMRTFEPNQIVVEYTGEIITQDECDHRMNTQYKDAKCYYLMDFDQGMVLDATRGSIARFINHSCAPNCRMIKWTVAGKPRMALFAGDEGIVTGEELTYDYNFENFSAKNVQECRCGAATCRGVLGPKPKEIKEALKPITTGGKRKIQQVVEDAVETMTKRRKLAVPSSVKSAFASAKAQTSRTLSQARALTAGQAQSERLVKKASERSLKGLKRKTTENIIDGKKSRRTTITYSRRHSSEGATNNDKKPKDANRRQSVPLSGSENTVKEEEKEVRPTSRKDSVKARAANVVRTVRGTDRGTGTPGKSIRVIGDDEFKEWR